MVNFENIQSEIIVGEDLVNMVDNIVVECVKDFVELHRKEVEVSVYLISDEEMLKINMEQRGVNKTTDVLSFPMNELDVGGDDPEDLDINPENGCVLLGDILISMEKCVAQAKEHGHSIKRELGFLVAHGVHHLLGYDHKNPMEELRMIKRQEKALASLGITREVI